MKLANPTQVLSTVFLMFMFTCLSAFAADDYCYKDSYGRGVGTIPNCSAGLQNDAGLCYKACNAGMHGVGPVCWSSCPAGYRDMGAVCHIDKALTTNGSWECHHRKWGVCWYWVKACPSGYTNAGVFCALNTPSVPAGFSGTGLDPMKNTYGRGVGTVPTDCGAKQKDAGLCYDGCRANYSGIGPVCWKACPMAAAGKYEGGDLAQNYVACGAGCASSSLFCAQVTSDQVISTLSLAANVATLGSSGAASGAAKSAEEAGRVSQEIKKAKEAWAAFKLTDKYKYMQEAKEAAKVAKDVKRMNDLQNASSTEEALRIMSGFDPTGMSQVVNAFTHRICGKPKLGS